MKPHLLWVLLVLTLLEIGSAQGSPILYPWIASDIGTVVVAGTSSFNTDSNSFSLVSSGNGLWDANDAFQFLSQTVADGDVQITARVVSQLEDDPWAKTGLMLRQSNDSTSPFAFGFVTPANGVNFQTRLTLGSQPRFQLLGVSGTSQKWLRLVRSGAYVVGYRSDDGVNWNRSTAERLLLTGPYMVGLAATSRDAWTLPGGAVAAYRFNETSGTSALDSSGNGRTAGLVGTAGWAAGKIKNSLKLTGSSNCYATLPTGILAGAQSMTVAAWVKWNGGAVRQPIFAFGSGTGAYMALTPQSEGGTLRFSILSPDSGYVEQQIDAVALPSGVWKHVAVTVSGNVGTLYVDGLPVAQNSTLMVTPGSLGATTQNWIGRSQYAEDPYFSGQVDEFQVYNRTLSANEVMSLVANTQVAYYRFAETSGTTASDSSGNGKNGTLMFSALWNANGVDLNGKGAHVVLPNGIVSGLKDFSVSAWVKWYGSTQGQQLFSFGSGTGVYMSLTPESSGSSLQFAIRAPGSAEEQINAPALPAGVWKHVVVTKQGSIGTLYVDGVQVAQNTALVASPADLGSTTHSWIGRSEFSTNPYFNGIINEFRIYSRALGAGEVADMGSGKSPAGLFRFSPPVFSSTSSVVGLGTSVFDNVQVSASPSVSFGSLPPAWSVGTIGSSSAPVFAAYDENSEAFVLTGSTGISGYTADSFNYVHRTWYGDGEFTVRVADLPTTAGFAQAGIVLRENMTPGAVCAGLYLNSEGEVVLSMRAAASGSMTTVDVLDVGAPAWLKLQRAGNQLKGYASLDGVSWTLVGRVVLPLGQMMQAETQVGLASSSIASRPSVTVMFDHLALTAADDDGDGLPDAWKKAFFGDANQSPADDPDADGMTNWQEFLQGTNPTVADSVSNEIEPEFISAQTESKAGVLERCVWLNITGGSVSDLTASAAFAGSPDIQDYITSAASPVNIADYYGQRLRGMITAPVTGEYTFWISSDDKSELWLGTSASRYSKRLIAYLSSWSAVQNWDVSPTQKSATIILQAGQKYWIEALQKENGGGDHVEIAWQYPGQDRQVIPGEYLSSPGVDPSDLNDNNLPDHWEIKYGVTGGEYADPDGNGLSNFQESLRYIDTGIDVWNVRDIGSTGVTGVTTYDPNAGSFSLTGAGVGIGGVADSFHFVSANASGSAVQITARLVSQQNVSGSEQAGVMIRQSRDTNAANAMVAVTPAQGISLQNRPVASGTSYSESIGAGAAPKWIRLVRSGNYVIGYRSEDGLNWDRAAAEQISLSGTYLVGLGLASKNSSSAKNAVFDNVSISGSTSVNFGALPLPWNAESISASGSSVIPATAAYSADAGVFLLTGSGVGISSTADSISFLHRTWYGDGTFAIRVVDVPNTATSAQAGLVLRESTQAGARSINLYVTPAGQVIFKTRMANGGTLFSAGSVSMSAPVWLKLQRIGAAFTGYASADGVTWTKVGSVISSLNSQMEWGIAGASASTRQSTPMFDRISMTGVDSNGNGLADAWEMAMFGSLDQTANGDPDGDGLTNAQEFAYGLNPLAYQSEPETSSDAEIVAASGVAPVSIGAEAPSGTSDISIPGVLECSVWLNISGTNVASLTSNAAFANNPDIKDYVTSAASPVNIADYYGQRLRGMITAPVTGEYTFWISSDDMSELWLGTSASRYSKRLIAYLSSWSAVQNWDVSPTQKSATIILQAGQKYWIEALHKEGNGGDHVEIAWQYPGQDRQVIPGQYLCTPGIDPSDLNDNNLPDDWEAAYGADGGTNFQEYLCSIQTGTTIWGPLDIGSTGVAGSTIYDPVTGRFSLTGAGADIGGGNDSFHFVGTKIFNGNVQITAHLASQQNVSGWEKAGVMVRQSRLSGAPNGTVAVTPSRGISFQYRPTQDGSSYTESLGTGAAPKWLRLVRSGNYLIGYRSEDGIQWDRAAAEYVSLSGTYMAGLGVTSKNNTLAVNAVFDSVSVSQDLSENFGSLPLSWKAETISASGSGTTTGTAAYSSHGSFLLTGSGVGIGSTADTVSYLHRTWYGDGTFVVHVMDVPYTTSTAQAGIALRESIEPGARSINLHVTPAGRVTFSVRSETDGSLESVKTLAMSVPVWLKIERVGDIFAGFASADGVSWTQVGDVVLSLNGQLEFGFIGASSSTRSSTSMFDKISMSGADTNGNSLPDAWELVTFGNLDQTANGDPDGDGLSNYQEFLYGTDPLNAYSTSSEVTDSAIVAQNAVEPIAVQIAPIGQPGVLEQCTWLNIPGSTLTDLKQNPRFSASPDVREYVNTSAVPENSGQNIGQRLRGTITAPVTGTYTFWISCDDVGELWLGSSESRFTKHRIITPHGATPSLNWDAYPWQRSISVSLVAGQRYWFEALAKQSNGNAHLQIAWKYPGQDRQLIPSQFLNAPLADPADSNDNGLPDQWEKANGITSGEGGDPDGDGLINYEEFLYGSNPNIAGPAIGYLSRDVWYGIQSQTVSALSHSSKFLKEPDFQDLCVGGSYPTVDFANDLGQRFRGTVTAPVSGQYTFWIASDDGSELWLSTDENKFQKKRIAYAENSVSVQAYGGFDDIVTQISTPITLQAGRKYYIEILHKNSGYTMHVEVAWRKPGGVREIIPSQYLTSFVKELDDLDDDDLPDSWERQYGLDATDNGVKFLKQASYGDYDGDGLTNREEYLLGTNPCVADTDGDGTSDSDEVTYASDPLMNDIMPYINIQTQQGSAFVSSSGQWMTLGGSGAVDIDRRGSINYNFSVPAKGIWAFQFEVQPVGNVSRLNVSIPLDVLVDGVLLGHYNLNSYNGVAKKISGLTQELQAGNHTIQIVNWNASGDRNLQINTVSILKPEGVDQNNDGVPDWVAKQNQVANSVNPVPALSYTSPICIEGKARFPEQATVISGTQSTGVLSEINGQWYANVPLNADGTTTTIVSNFGGCQVSNTNTITWAALNVVDFDNSTMVIRKGDSLRLTGYPQGGQAVGNVQLTITSGTNVISDESISAETPMVYTFAQPGIFTVQAIVSGTQTVTLTVDVKDATFGDSLVGYVNCACLWKTPQIGTDLTLEWDNNLYVNENAATIDGRSFQVMPLTSGTLYGVARLNPGGPIVARGVLQASNIYNASTTGDCQIISTNTDGSSLVKSSIVIDLLPPGGYAVVQVFVSGVTFEDGTTKKILTASDFINGVATFYMNWSNSHSVCHHVYIYDAEGNQVGVLL